MKYRYLGSTKIKVSEIGFGAWGIGGNFNQSKAYGPTSDEVSSSALLEAIDRGVNFFDTSPLYGFGHSEELIGKTLKKYRDKIIILTKVGYVDFTGKQVFSYNYLKESLELSLRRLKTEYVDILQLHDLPIKFIEDSSGYSFLCAEVNLQPRNERSLRFHEKFGFKPNWLEMYR